VAIEPGRGTEQPSAMNPITAPRRTVPDAPRLPVWDERARKMGFPPTTR